MSDREAYAEFDLCGPLPTGVTVLEASAGTGKTYTIAALAARYVAEGTPLERLLLITFTRMATGELRDRVRERLVGVRAGAVARSWPARPATDRRSGRGAARLRLDPRRSPLGATGSPARSPTSTPPRSPPPTASARRCWPSSARSATSTGRRSSSRTSPTCSRRRSTTSTCGGSGRAAALAFTRAEALPDRARGRGQSDGRRSSRADEPDDSTRVDALPPGHARPGRARAAQAPAGGHDLRRSAHAAATTILVGPRRRRRPGSGCAPATTWCWSTSSRTPIRSSGRSCRARSRPAA